MTHLKHLLSGAADLFSVFSYRPYDLPQRGDFVRDAANLRGDTRNVLLSLRQKIDQQSHKELSRG